jgi:D-glycero-alpha-D-manno-heptose-7-phosphate kinase
MIISKTPFRVSFVGGGSDLKSFYETDGGAVISTSIDKYIYLSMHKYFHEGKQILKYSKTELVTNIDEIKHDIIREVYRYFKIENTDFNSIADIPAGTGMGSSSAFTSGLINLCASYKNLNLTKAEIARLACEIEIDILKEPIGKQDQFACALGGLNLIKFNQDETVSIEIVNMPFLKQVELQNNLYLYYTNITRSASDVLKEQNTNTLNNSIVKSNLREMSKMAIELSKELIIGNIDAMGSYLNEAWMKKKELAKNISNPYIDELYEYGINSGASGGKLLGAGGGGFILFYVPTHKKNEFKINMQSQRELSFNFEQEGTTIIFNNQNNKI